MPDGNRLVAIQTLAALTVSRMPEELLDEAAGEFAACMLALGVTIDEIRDAMQFAMITSEDS